jgi:hypothetical protein
MKQAEHVLAVQSGSELILVQHAGLVSIKLLKNPVDLLGGAQLCLLFANQLGQCLKQLLHLRSTQFSVAVSLFLQKKKFKKTFI